jgi:transcriptional regulator with XRE-family HTH domain
MATDELPAFGVLLTRYRAALGLTQEELAERADLSVRGIRDLERGVKTRPRALTIRQLAEALQLSLEDRDAFEQAARAGVAAGRSDAIPRTAANVPGKDAEQRLPNATLDRAI